LQFNPTLLRALYDPQIIEYLLLMYIYYTYYVPVSCIQHFHSIPTHCVACITIIIINILIYTHVDLNILYNIDKYMHKLKKNSKSFVEHKYA